jgi:hypothetical protein
VVDENNNHPDEKERIFGQASGEGLRIIAVLRRR